MSRTPHDLTADDIVLGHFTLGRSYPLRERLAIAAEAEVAGIGLFMGDIERWATDDRLATMLDEHADCCSSTSMINLAAARPARERSQRFVRRAAELADRFGCRYLQTIAPHAEPGAAGSDETTDALGRIAGALAPHGVEVGLEYTGFDDPHPRRRSRDRRGVWAEKHRRVRRRLAPHAHRAPWRWSHR